MFKKFKDSTKKNYFILTLIGLSLSGILFSGCKKDEENISPDTIKQFLGSYSVTDDDEGYISTYSITISESSKGKQYIDISNFGDLMNVKIHAVVSGNKMTIPAQKFDSNDKSYTMTLTGEGTINGNVLNYTYKFFVDEKNDEDWEFGGVCVATKK